MNQRKVQTMLAPIMEQYMFTWRNDGHWRVG